MILGAKLYTVIKHTQTTEDLAETLAKVADIGYKTVQISGTCAFEPAWMTEQLNKNGLTCAVTHTGGMDDNTQAVVEEHRVFGCSILGMGSMPGNLTNGFADYIAFRERFVPAAKKVKEAGALLAFHNHSRELY